MSTDDLSNPTSSITKSPISRKHRSFIYNQTTGKSPVDNLHTNVISTTRLPSLLSKSSIFPSTSDTMHFKRYRSQKDIFNTTSSKIERQTTNISSQIRLPTLCTTTTNDNDQKRKCEYQRRQIYALNHLMRELEQEQFREFCKLNGIGTVDSEEIVTNNEELNNEPIT